MLKRIIISKYTEEEGGVEVRLKLFKDSKLDDDYIEIRYRKMNMQINQIIEVVGNQQPYVLAKKKDSEFKIELQDILYYETVDKKYFLYTEQDVYEIQMSLNDTEESLSQYGFIRINKSMIVNTFKVCSLTADVNMRILACLVNGEIVKVTRHYRKSFYQMIKNISFDKKEGNKHEDKK